MTAKTKKLKETTVTIICHACEGDPVFIGGDFMAHLKDKHGIERGTKGSKQGISFMDGGGGWYANTYRWNIGGVEFIQTIEGYSQ